jgi:hypothetical protein
MAVDAVMSEPVSAFARSLFSGKIQRNSQILTSRFGGASAFGRKIQSLSNKIPLSPKQGKIVGYQGT